MNPDFAALLRELSAADARYLIVGAYAVNLHTRPRATGDLAVWIEPTPVNAARVYLALKRFGAPLTDLAEADLATPGLVFQVGVPPRRIDLLTSLTGLGFEPAWDARIVQRIDDLQVPFLGRDDLIRNKLALGRPRDLADVEALRSAE